MAIKSIVESLEEVPEALHEDYEEGEDGKFVLRKDAFEDHPAWKKLKGTLNSVDREKREAQKKAQRFDQLAEVLPEDLDLSEADEDRREKAFQYLRGEIDFDGGSGDPSPDQIEKIKRGEREKAQKQVTKVQEDADRYKNLFIQTVRDQALTEALSEAKVLEPLRPAVQAMFRDKAKVEVGDDGQPSVMIEGEYGPQDLKSYMKEWAQTDQGAYFVQAPENRGGGARGGQGSGRVKNPWSPDNWSMTEQSRIYREDPERARKMAAEHGKKVG